jgi:RHS repeat-associated protein
MGRLTRTTHPDGTTEASTYDAEGRRLTSTDRAGRTTTFTYDALGRLIQTTYPDSATTTTTYDAAGQTTATADERGNTTQYEYDAAGRRTQITDALGNVTTFTYDAAGNQLTMTDANGNTTSFEYDGNNRRTRGVYPDGTFDETTYDALGRTISKTDQAGLTTQFEYDALGRLTNVTDALGQVTQYTYDEVGNQISQTDANNNTMTFGYDSMGRRIRGTLPLGMLETFLYDAAGNLISKTDFNGKITTYTYDTVNRLLNKIPDPSLGEPTVSFTYTSTGQRASMVDASGTTVYTYDGRDRLINKATPQGTLTYTYDPAGNLLSIRSSNANGTSVDYTYDTLNRLAIVTDHRLTPGTTTYSYDAVGNLAGYVYPNGVQSNYIYNTLNRLTHLTLSKVSSLASYTYTLGSTGNRLAVTELNGRQVNYTYDDLYRLTNETITSDPTPTNNGSISYTYDPVGNRLSRTSTVAAIPNQTFAYDANDRLTSDTYDNNGNTIASEGNTYAYDFENHLIGQNTGAVTIVYDGDGNRVSKTVGSITTQYLVDDRNPTGFVQVVEEIVNGSVQRVYTYGLDLISQSQLLSGVWTTSFYGYDGHGSMRFLTDASGAVTDRYEYEAFGNLIGSTGSTPNSYLFTGEQNDPNVGFYYLRARYYSSQVGRFISSDSWQGNIFEPITLHKYVYANLDPINLWDPTGNFVISLERLGTVSIQSSLWRLDVLRGFSISLVLTVRLWEAGLISSNTVPSLPIQLSRTAVGQQALMKARATAKEEVDEERPKCSGNILYHYTDFEGALGITHTQAMRLTPPMAHISYLFPLGAYATNVEPWDPNWDQKRLNKDLYIFPRKDNLSFFVILCNDVPPIFEQIPPTRNWVKQPRPWEIFDGNVRVHALGYFKNPMP